jgi:vesicle coat complex subunit
MYDEMLQMRVNAESVKESLREIYGLSPAAADGVIARLDEVLKDYNLRLKTMKPEDVFAAE